MGAFETPASKAKKSTVALPADLPTASDSAGPDGGVYKTDSGQRFRLRHSRTVGASWSPVVARKPKATVAAGHTASASASRK